MNELYEVPKDLAYIAIENSGMPNDSCSLCVCKACVDTTLTSRTIHAALGVIRPAGCIAVECNHRTLSHVVDICEDLSYGYDVVYFRGNRVMGHRFETRRAKQIPYVLLYKSERCHVRGHTTNEVTLVGESPSDEIMAHLLCFTDTGRVLFIGDSLLMAPTAIATGREVVCFGDNPLSVVLLKQLGTKLTEVQP